MKPASPAVIIGLGGTGQWVLTYVKKNLIDTYGEVPSIVRLLSFDTTGEKTEASVEKGEEHARVGNIQLDRGEEFVYLGGNIRNIAREITQENKHPHISSWFQADIYRGQLDDDAYEISKGAGQRRPFGRMAVFYDLTKSPSDVLGKIGQAITDVKTHNEKNQQVEIYLICSLAGGTGSGMFIDIAHITRQLAESAHVGFAMRAFLVLQNTFESVIDTKPILANSFAAIRELDRFLQVFDRDYPIYYADDKTRKQPLNVYHSIYDSKLFDNVYLLDARRKDYPLDGAKPWLGVFPAASECITALLDPETGDTFAQHYKNVNERLANRQKDMEKALYSSLGTYTYILPVEDIIETAVHRASIQLIGDYLFSIKKNSQTGDLKVSSENQSELSEKPRQAVLNFFKDDKFPNGASNIPFFQQMVLTLEGGRLDDRQYIEDMALRGLELLSWLMPVEDDKTVNQVSETIQAIIDASVDLEVVTSEIVKDDTHSGADRIKREVREFREKKLGSEEESGRPIPGELQKGLAEYALRNRKRFRRSLAETLEMYLNGISSDQLVAKKGKLPYVQEFMDWLLKTFEEFSGFLRRVNGYRAESGEISLAREDVILTDQTMYDTRDLDGVMDRLKKTAIHAQEDYIAAENYLFSLEREDALYQALMDYVEMFKTIVLDAKGQLDNWAEVLTLGGAVDSGESGAYSILLQQQANLKRRRDEQQAIKVYDYLTDSEYEDKLYGQSINTQWSDILRRFKWQIRLSYQDDDARVVSDGNVRYRFDWEENAEKTKEARERKSFAFKVLLSYGEEELAQTPVQRQPASSYNAMLLANLLRAYFAGIRNETIAGRLMEYKRADGLAKDMLDYSGALIRYADDKQSALEKHNFVCVNRGVNIDYFKELEAGLKGQAPRDMDNQVIGLTNRHRAIILSTLDMLVGQEVDPVIESRKEYMEHTGNHSLLHNFPAEVNASTFEARIPQPPIGERRRLLSPILVALLEDKDMMRRYLMSRVFGLLKEEPGLNDDTRNQFILRLDRENRYDINSIIRMTQLSERPRELDAMTEFVFVHIDRQTGERFIRDVTHDSHIQASPSRVDEAVTLRQDAITTGREAVVEKFDELLQNRRALLNQDDPQARQILAGAFRRFMMADYDRYDRDIRLGDEEKLQGYIKIFLEDNRDCLASGMEREKEDALLKSFADEIATLVREAKNIIKPQPNDVLVRMLEEYIDAEVKPKRRSNDPLEKDLGTVMHLLLWDEIGRLQRTQKN